MYELVNMHERLAPPYMSLICMMRLTSVGFRIARPGTRLDLRLNPDGAPKTFSKPVDRVDFAALRHDLAYAQYPDTASRNVADREMVDELNKIPNPTFRERVERAIVKPILATKANLGLG